jgi:F-type H+-transporting ATPase subunit b
MIPTRVVTALALGLALLACSPAFLPAQASEDAALGQAERQAGREAVQLGDQAAGKAEAGAHDVHGEQGNPNPLEFRTDLTIWTGIVFLVLMFVLWWFAWGPIASALDQREQAVANQIAAAEKSNQDSQKILAQYEQKLADAKNEVRALLDQARREAEQAGRQIVETARGEAREEQQRALVEIENATAGALKELAERSADLAVGLAGKIVRAELKPSDHRGLVERAMADFVAQKSSDSQAP